MSDLWSANKISQFVSTSERHTSCSSVLRGSILLLHLSCQSSKENLAWQWWMHSHDAECCLTYLVKGGEMGSEWEQKQKGVSGVCYAVGPRAVFFFFSTGRVGAERWTKREQRGKSWRNGKGGAIEKRCTDRKNENIWRFKYASRRPWWIMCDCSRVENNPALQRLPGLGRGDRVSDAFSGFGEMCPCLMMYWHPWVGTGA